MKRFIVFFLLFSAVAGRSAAQQPERVVIIETDSGNIKIKLYNETPLHRDNFLKLVEKKFYDSLLFHRVINKFMIQGGDPDSKKAPSGKKLGEGDVGYTLPAEFNSGLFHKRGVLAAARNPDEENPEQASSGCQFYIVQGKIFNDSLLNEAEKRVTRMKAYNNVCRKNPAALKNLTARLSEFQEQENADSMKAVKARIDHLVNAELPNVTPYKFTKEQREAYKTVGGTPHLDGSYTAFGEVIAGVEVVDKIAAVKTDGDGRPRKNIRMRISVIR